MSWFSRWASQKEKYKKTKNKRKQTNKNKSKFNNTSKTIEQQINQDIKHLIKQTRWTK